MSVTTYSDITPRVNAFADRLLLVRALPNNILSQFAQVRTLPSRKSKTIIFRRFEALAAATVPLAEGVTPTGKSLTKTDVQVSLKQYGDFITITDVVRDTHEDPVLNESVDLLGEQAGLTWDVLTFGVIKAGTTVQYSNGTTRSAVNSIVTRDEFRIAEKTLLGQNAKVLRQMIQAGPKIGTNAISPAYIALCHTDLKRDLEQISGWTDVKDYANTMGLIRGEIGSLGLFRFVTDTNLVAFPDAGGTASTNSTYSTSGTSSDVYPIIIVAKNSYAMVPLAGKNNVQTLVSNPRPQNGDPLAQRGTVAWKGYHAAIILNDNFMLRIETAISS